MERIQRALELARLQRSGNAVAVRVSPPRVESSRGDEQPQSTQLRRVSLDTALARRRPIVMPDSTSPAAYSYRMLRAQLLRKAREHKVRAIGIVSAADREGKTLTAVNLALSIAAEPNQSVLLMDLDLRKPGIASLLDLPVDQGFESWLAGRAEISEVCYCIKNNERLTILPTLSPVPGSSETLASARVQELVADLKTRQPEHLMILDLPPVLLTDDYLTIAPQLDGVIVVAMEGRTRREDLARVRELLGQTRLLGTVLNNSAQSEQRAY